MRNKAAWPLAYRDHWIAAITRDTRPFEGRTRGEVQIAIRAERRLAKTNANKDLLNALNSKKLIELWSPEKYDERIGLQQREMARLYSKFGMTVAMPECVLSQDQREPNPVHNNSYPDTNITNQESQESLATKVDSESSEESFWEDINGYH